MRRPEIFCRDSMNAACASAKFCVFQWGCDQWGRDWAVGTLQGAAGAATRARTGDPVHRAIAGGFDSDLPTNGPPTFATAARLNDQQYQGYKLAPVRVMTARPTLGAWG